MYSLNFERRFMSTLIDDKRILNICSFFLCVCWFKIEHFISIICNISIDLQISHVDLMEQKKSFTKRYGWLPGINITPVVFLVWLIILMEKEEFLFRFINYLSVLVFNNIFLVSVSLSILIPYDKIEFK